MRDRESFNIVDRLFGRQILGCPPASGVVRQRQVFEVIVPNDEAKQIEPPDGHICKFLPSGDLVCFGSLQHELVVYRYSGPSFSHPGDAAVSFRFPEGLPFNRFFQVKFRKLLAQGDELLCKELCLVAGNGRFLVVASCSHQPIPPPHAESATQIQGVPVIKSTTIHLVSAEDGRCCSSYSIADDFVHLSHANGLFLFEDMLCILAVRSQTIHLLHITERGNFVLHQRLGSFCRDDDELAIAVYEAAAEGWSERQEEADVGSHAQGSAEVGPEPSSEALAAQSIPAPRQNGRLPSMQRSVSAPLPREPVWSRLLTPSAAQRERRGQVANAATRVGALIGPRDNSTTSRPGSRGMIEGVRQRLMAYLFLCTTQKNARPDARRLFFYHFEAYASLAIWKVQMLDREHLLMSMGPRDAGMTRENGSLTAHNWCLLVWSLPEARVIGVHDMTSAQLLQTYQDFWQHFHGGCVVSTWHRFLSPSIGCRTRATASTPSAVVRRVLSNLPTNSQMLSPSPYLDAQLFHYDEKLISAMIRPRPFTETPLKFAARRGGRARFKLQPPGADATGPANGSRTTRHIVAYHFHPWLPVVLCFSQSFISPQLTIFLRSQ